VNQTQRGRIVQRRQSSWVGRVSVAAVLGASVMLAAACSSGGAQNQAASSGTSGSKPVTLGISMPFLSADFEVVLEKQLVSHASQLGMKVLPPTNADMQSGQQITDVRNLISEGATAIVVIANDSKAIIPALEYAKSHHVPVVSLDIGPNGGKVAMIVRADNVQMGVDACMAIGKDLHGTGQVLSLEGALTSINGLDRTTGFHNCIAKNFPHITLIEKPTNWDPATQSNDIQTVLTANPDLQAIYMQSDWALSAALQTIKQAGHGAAAGQSGHIYTTSIDGTPLGLSLVQSGHLDAEISQPLNLYVRYGLQYIQEAVAGKTFAAGPSSHGTTVQLFNGNPMDLMPPTLVTKANVDDPNLWGNELKQ
jgi:ribose transport system substrate-binding protein